MFALRQQNGLPVSMRRPIRVSPHLPVCKEMNSPERREPVLVGWSLIVDPSGKAKVCLGWFHFSQRFD